MKCPHCGVLIDEHEASRCLNAWVAEAVMGWLDVKMGRDDYGGQPIPEDRNAIGELLIWAPVHAYSTDIAAAWEVLERVWEKGKPNETKMSLYRHDGSASITFYGDPLRIYELSAYGDSPAHAICRAALKGLGE